jgi:glycosyltransferase involved in cell wall biosynthesis
MSQRVSLCLIVKNEEERLPKCLSSSVDLVHETIVVDTGSTDRTKEVAGRFGVRLYDFAWRDDFAAAMNESIRWATGEWVFWLHAKEAICAERKRRC